MCVDDMCGLCYGIGKSLGIDFDFYGVFFVLFDLYVILVIRVMMMKVWGIFCIMRMMMKVRKMYFCNNKFCG